MQVAVTSQNFRTITGHAGKSRRFLIYEAGPEGGALEVERLDLPKEMSFHELHGEGAHPVDSANVLVTASCGQGFTQRMAGRGIVVVVTSETDPKAAAEAVLKGESLPPAQEEHAHGEHGAGAITYNRHK